MLGIMIGLVIMIWTKQFLNMILANSQYDFENKVYINNNFMTWTYVTCQFLIMLGILTYIKV